MALRAALLAAVASAAYGAYCNGKPNPNAQPNKYPINTAAPVLNRTAPNGKAYVAGAEGFEFWVVHVYGSPYEQGFAQGTMFRDELKWIVNATWAYMESQVTGALSFLPAWLSETIANFGLEVALDLLIKIDEPSTPKHFYEELHGLADASGSSYETLLRVHFIGELTQGDCSMVGAWGKATAGGKTYALRALDWDTDIPTNQYPATVIYHPDADNGHAFANVGFLGWVGSLTGQSSAQLSIHEIGVAFPDDTFGKESYEGIPFIFLLRDILQYDKSYKDAISRIETANRTCDLILGVGDGGAGTFRAFEYSHSVANVFDDTNMMPWNETDTWHPRFENIVYYGMDWNCPNYDRVLAAQLNASYGALTPEYYVSDVLAIVQTGDVHAAVYDLTDQFLYVSFEATAASSVPTPFNAYDRQFTRLDLKSLFAEPRPPLK